MKKRAVFLDRDGVINRTFLRDGKIRAPDRLDQFEFFPGVKEGIDALKEAGFLTIVVTNQPDVARGWQTKEAVDSMNTHVMRELKLDDLKVCFHTDEHGCHCRKPSPGMLVDSAQQWDIDLTLSYMVGDRLSDLQAGNQAGCTSLLVVGGMGSDLDDNLLSRPSGAVILPAVRVNSLLEASQWILRNELAIRMDLAETPDFR